MATNEAAISQLFQAKHSGITFPVGGKCLTNLPFTASTALNCLFSWPLFMKVTVIVDPRVSEDTFCRQLIKYRPQVTVMTGCWWSNYFRYIEKELNKGKNVNLSYLTMPIIGGGGSSAEEIRWINGILKRCKSAVPVYSGFGLSETFSTVAFTRSDFVPEESKEVASVGIPYPGVTVGVFDENGSELSYNQRGELRIKSPSVMKGYYKKEKLTAEALNGGWVHTGDLAEISEDGQLYIWGRINDSIIHNGNRIYLFDIAMEMEKSADIKQAMVLPLPGFETPHLAAYIVPYDNRMNSRDNVIKALDNMMKKYLPEGLELLGYKIYETALPSSPTTAKKDRKRLMSCEEYLKPRGGDIERIVINNAEKYYDR